ncbi:MAG: hypothetical protein JJT75_13755, partial [Opitutales bacterium]|nr:hypothetical protein [Opitutales bacterium]
GEPQARLVEILRGLRGDEWGKEVLREYRMLLLGQAGGDGAKEEMAELLSHRVNMDGKWLKLLPALVKGVILGSGEYVGKIKRNFWGEQEGSGEIYPGLVAGQKSYRK